MKPQRVMTAVWQDMTTACLHKLASTGDSFSWELGYCILREAAGHAVCGKPTTQVLVVATDNGRPSVIVCLCLLKPPALFDFSCHSHCWSCCPDYCVATLPPTLPIPIHLPSLTTVHFPSGSLVTPSVSGLCISASMSVMCYSKLKLTPISNLCRVHIM